MRPLNRTCLLLTLAACSGFAQNAAPPKAAPPNAATPHATQQDEIPVFTADTRLVVVHASVLDKNGKLITSLPESAFKIQENGADQAIKLFRREDIPVSMGIIIDNSGSMRDKRAKVAAASLDLIRASNPQDEIFVVNFNDDAFLDQSLTNDIKKLETALERYDTKGGTAMRDAISMSIDYVKEKGKKDKKVLMVVTDGNDNTSNQSLEDLVRKAQQSDVVIYSIGILSEEEPREAKKAKRALHELALASGGVDYYPKDLAEIDRITPEIAHEIRNQYTIAYTPTNTALDGTFRKISVVVNAPGGKPTVRTRNGYYATASNK
ncbi:MAG TPA: VWA domain-containing protein [Bryobacteraceae bacterium]|nr:VWA domain-containing protein [Bryobacteraceae bacterium]